jgi:hypothetical protein
MRKFAVFFFLIALTCLSSINSYAVNHVPVLTSPAHLDSCVNRVNSFSWQEETNIVGYTLQVSEDQSFLTGVMESALTTNSTTISLPKFNTTYYWRVVVEFRQPIRPNTYKDTSDVRSFKTIFDMPSLVSPANLATSIKNGTEFKISYPQGASKAQIQFSINDDFTNIAKDTTIENTDKLVASFPNTTTQYYWRARAQRTSGCSSAWSNVSSFTTASVAPKLAEPIDNKIGVELNPTLKWDDIAPAVSYHLIVSKKEDFSSPIVDVNNLNTNSYSLSNLDNNTAYFWKVEANREGSFISNWSATRKFTTLYPTVVKLTPEDNLGCVPLTPQFKWKAAGVARAYTLQVSINADFSDTVVIAKNISDTVAVVKVTLGATKHYWRVKAEDSRNIGDWSVGSVFTTTYNAPQLLKPLASSLSLDKAVLLKWTKNLDNAEYIIQVSSVADFASKIFADTITSDTITVNLPQYNTTYYWRVATIDAKNCVGDWSEVRSFKTKIDVAKLLLPSDKAVNQNANINLEWQAVASASEYNIQVSKDSLFNPNKLTFELYHIKGLSVFVSNLESNTKYFWRVRAVNNESTGDWSKFFSFTTAKVGAEIPTLVYPINESVKLDTNLELKWNKSARALRYYIQISKDKSFANLFVEAPALDTNVYNAKGLASYTTYFWRVAAINDSGRTAWSEIRSFRTIMSAIKNAPVLTAPEHNSKGLEKFVTLKWNSVYSAERYKVQVSKTEDFASDKLILNDSLTTKLTKDLVNTQYEIPYFWRVAAINEAGQGPWSEVRKFTIKPDPADVEYTNDVKVNITPNPSAGEVTINFDNANAGNVEIMISDISGRLVRTLNTNGSTVNMNLNDLSNGSYYLTIATPKGKSTQVISISK